ncbi:GntR family transcriptional regulator [Engelhardtia mirabilis]|uniref:HTH-type transcriptional repressor YtrA n=1 Tax=Engelhardtia mirabilis TaxID=2528011 RepID=A0A518BE33_9BACT|nr:HTH-type transcriptional repressor YtrA [Planctomycetes bacterium Pla133]QDU99574.1 HTH-type transcriptional repressor YtrA [Planctomycetes bacterium Pla86]
MAPPVHLHLTPGDDAPLYRQLVRQVASGIATGSLIAGERLPSLRELAARLVVAPLTVKKAYDELEAQGLIETRRGQGTFVRADAARSKQDSAERLRPHLRRLLVEAELAGLEPAALNTLIEAERAVLEAERAAQRTSRGTRNESGNDR